MAKKLIPPKNSSSPTRVIEKLLKEKLIGQERAIREIIRGLERAYSGLKNPDHPVAVLAFFGPTGTGKTFAAEALANCFPRHKVWRCPRHYECGYVITEEERQAGIQVAEYCPTHNGKLRIEKIVSNTIWTIDCGGVSGALDHAITTLMGSPPSYVGQEITPIFTGGKAPHVVLFDEAEKALLTKNWSGGSSFANVLLKILEKGRIRNNLNEEIDFTQSIIILTGNLGAAEILKEFEGVLGFHVSSKDRHRDIAQMTDQEVGDLNKRIYSVVKKKAERDLAPEFLNRLDRLVVFHFLTRSGYERILQNEIAKLQSQIARAIKRKKVPAFVLTFTPAALDYLLREAMADRRFGARPLVRVLEKRVVTPLAELINNRVIRAGDHLQARVEKAADGDEELEETIVFFLTSSSKERPLKSHKSGNA